MQNDLQESRTFICQTVVNWNVLPVKPVATVGDIRITPQFNLPQFTNYSLYKFPPRSSFRYLENQHQTAICCVSGSTIAFFTKAKGLEPIWNTGAGLKQSADFESASIEIDGVMTPVKNSDGTFNMDAVKALAERDYSFLLDDFKLTMGAIYE